MGGFDGDDELATVEVYSPKTNSWRSCTPMSQPRIAAVAGVVGGRLVVAGGACDGEILASAEAYTGTGWTPLPPMPHAADEATACVLNGRLYVMGGMGCNKLQVLEISEENEFSWTVKADLPAARWYAASAVVDGKLWLIGGEDADTAHTDSICVYAPERDAWANGAPLPRAVAYGSATTHDGEVYFIARGVALVYRGDAWHDVAGGPHPDYPTCRSLLLG